MHTDQQVKKRLLDEFNDIERSNMWNVAFRVSKFNGCRFSEYVP